MFRGHTVCLTIWYVTGFAKVRELYVYIYIYIYIYISENMSSKFNLQFNTSLNITMLSQWKLIYESRWSYIARTCLSQK